MSTGVKAALRYGSQLILLFAPMLTMKWSLIDLWLGPLGAGDVAVNMGLLKLVGPKEQVELELRAIFSAVAFGLVLTNELLEVFLPHRRMLEFRRLYLESQGESWRMGFDAAVRDTIRINIMHVRRPWYFLGMIRQFHWTWNDGFGPPAHRDSGLALTEFQGVCGLSLRAEEAKFADLRKSTPLEDLPFHQKYLLCNSFRMTYWQLRKTQSIKAILSIPLFREQTNASDAKRWKPVGVINLDSSAEEGADWIEGNREELATYFTRVGKIVACLR